MQKSYWFVRETQLTWPIANLHWELEFSLRYSLEIVHEYLNDFLIYFSYLSSPKSGFISPPLHISLDHLTFSSWWLYCIYYSFDLMALFSFRSTSISFFLSLIWEQELSYFLFYTYSLGELIPFYKGDSYISVSSSDIFPRPQDHCWLSIWLTHQLIFSQVAHMCACMLSLQLCPTLCHPMDCSLPGSSVHGIL